jgi:hypothetical protein
MNTKIYIIIEIILKLANCVMDMNITKFFCHRLPERSFFIKGHQFPVCARCTGFYTGLIVYLIANLFYKHPYDLGMLFISMLLMVPAAIKGWFRSKNILTKAFAAYIFISILELYPFGIPAFSMHFLMIWIGVAMCNSKYMRNLTNEQIKGLLFNKA